MKRHSLVFLACLVLLAPGLQAADPAVTVEALRGPLHLLQGRGGNVVASVGADGVLLVDDGYAEMVTAYSGALEGLGATGHPAFVLNTHWHDDHTGGNTYWGERQAVIVAHANVRKRMSERQEVKALERIVEPAPAIARPVVTYGDSIALYFNDTDIELQHQAHGHTDGDTVVYFAQHNTVHTGDLFFRDRFPFVDVSSGGSIAGYLAGVDAILARTDDNTLIVPGHGSLARRDDLQRFRDVIASTSASVQADLAAGRSLEEIIRKGLASKWDDWGKGFISEENWIRIIATDYAASPGRAPSSSNK